MTLVEKTSSEMQTSAGFLPHFSVIQSSKNTSHLCSSPPDAFNYHFHDISNTSAIED